jgi:type IV pilus assembly protein PilB
MARRIRLGESLVEAGLINQVQLDEALNRRLTTGERVGEALVGLGYITERDLLRALATDADIPFLEPRDLVVHPTVASLIPTAVARAQLVLPLRLEGRALVVAMANPFDVSAIRTLERATGKHIRPVAADPEAVSRIIDGMYAASASSPATDSLAVPEISTMDRRGPAAVRSRGPTTLEFAAKTPASAVLTSDQGGTTAELVDSIIREGVQLAATDIHIEPLENKLHVRYRVDGILQDGPSYSKTLQAPIMSRIKILSGLDIAENRLPQDGRVRLHVATRSIDLRVSTFPTVHGEDVVLRILDRGRINLKLESLGIEPEDLALLREALKRPFGLIPVTGPTGSGKTTTLYSALLEMNTGERCLITLEDPVEYEVETIRQSQINVRAGLTFAAGLRSMLRHDPDVILVGEMRDQETVEIALSAALTGHMVLTTLHTTTAAGAIPRLLDMGAEPFIVASAVSLIASQRLVRTLCAQCRVIADLPDSVRQRFGLVGATLYRGGGCPTCRNTGFRGRLGIFEFLPMTEEIATAIYDRRPSDQIRQMAKRPTLLDDGLRKVRAGLTTLDEVLRVSA